MTNINDKMQMEIEPIPSHWIAQVKFDKEIVDLINDYIDETADHTYSYADRLVGQLKNDERSSQVSFDLDSEQGKEIEVIFNGIGSAYLQQAYKRKSIAQVVDIWTNHAYAGDYNPLHDHNAAHTGWTVWFPLVEDSRFLESRTQRWIYEWCLWCFRWDNSTYLGTKATSRH